MNKKYINVAFEYFMYNFCIIGIDLVCVLKILSIPCHLGMFFYLLTALKNGLCVPCCSIVNCCESLSATTPNIN